MIPITAGIMGSLCEVESDLVLFIYNDNLRDKLRAQFIRVKNGKLMPDVPA
jgi:hypothetical protein